MNALLNHKWGRSPAQDRVWAQVTGLAPNGAIRRLLMSLKFQAFIDGSSRPPDGDFVLGGYIATAETWAQFSKDWEELLPLGTRAKNGKLHFKMSEMARSDGGMARAQHFHAVIERYPLIAIFCRLNHTEFANAFERVEILLSRFNIANDFKQWKNPYFFLFRQLLDRFHEHRVKFEDGLPLDQKVDFIFDDQSEKSYILAAWDEIVEGQVDEIRDRFGATPRFENDQEFLPLQAADFLAWWVREWFEEDAPPPPEVPDKMKRRDFGKWRGSKPFRVIAINFGEDELVDALQAITFSALPHAFQTGAA